MLRYLRLIFVPSVMNLKRKQPKAHDQINASNVCCDCNCTESFNHSTLKNANKSNVKINAPETITSTERCGPRLCMRRFYFQIILLIKQSNHEYHQPLDRIEH